MTAEAEFEEKFARLPPDMQQRFNWQLRNCMWFVERMPPEDRDTALEMFAASLEQSFYEGVQDAAWVVEQLSGAMPERAIQIVSKAIRELAGRSKPDFSMAAEGKAA